MDDDTSPRVFPTHGPAAGADAASRLADEDLGPYSQDELIQRIHLLEREIARVEKHRLIAAAHRDAADALFGRKD